MPSALKIKSQSNMPIAQTCEKFRTNDAVLGNVSKLCSPEQEKYPSELQMEKATKKGYIIVAAFEAAITGGVRCQVKWHAKEIRQFTRIHLRTQPPRELKRHDRYGNNTA